MSAEMPPALRQIIDELRDVDDESMQEILDHAEEIWDDPAGYEQADYEISVSNRELFFFQFGIEFGLHYERAYPAGESEDWPVPVEER